MKEACVFCDRPQFAERLVAEDKNFYVIASLGQITEGGYLLVVPKRHVLCVGEMNAEGAAKVGVLAEYLAGCLGKEYGSEVTLFEHGIVGQSIQHAHLHLVPARLRLDVKIVTDFPTCEIDRLNSIRDVPRAYGYNKEPYLFWQEPGESPSICYINSRLVENFPKQYLRRVAADLLGRPERADWKAMDPKLDGKLWSETVQRLKNYF